MRKIIFTIGITFLVTGIYAQQWLGSSNANGNIFRNGSVNVILSNGEGNATNINGNIATFQSNNDQNYYASINVIGGTQGKTSLYLGDKDNAASGGISYRHDENSLSFRTNGNDKKMVINSVGNVGVGVPNPSEKLTVDGTVYCTEVKVESSVTPDYVFEKYYNGVSTLKADYNMPTLKEVEAYTKVNHHLPEMPSAKEIQENGLKLKEMTNLLLQKIEELTLYTIEQEKRINALESKLTSKE